MGDGETRSAADPPERPVECWCVHGGVERLLWREEELALNRAFIRGCLERRDNRTKHCGKYAFVRVLHAQEIVSSAFSAFSLLSVAWALAALLRAPKAGRRVHALVLGAFFVVQGGAWGSSAAFHFRDCAATQYCDYFFAVLSILACACVSAYRSSRHGLLALSGSALFFAGHVGYMCFVRFDFAYNSFACGALLAVNAVLWLRWYAQIANRPYAALLKAGARGLIIASFFQAVDFGPALFLVDSHALFHVLACAYSAALYAFLIADFRLREKA